MTTKYSLIPFNFYSDSQRLLIKRLGKTLSFPDEKALVVMHLLQLMNQMEAFDLESLNEQADDSIPAEFIQNLIALLYNNGFLRTTNEPPPASPLEIPYQNLSDLVGEEHFILIGINKLSIGILELLQAYAPDLSFDLLSYDGLDFPHTLTERPEWEKQIRSFDDWKADYSYQDNHFIIAATVFGNKKALRSFNQFAYQQKLQYLPILLLDYQLEIGPIFMPGITPCYECVYKRFLTHFYDTDQVESFYRMIDQNSPNMVHFSDEVLYSACSGVSTLQILNYLSGNQVLLQSGYQLDWNISNNTSTSHRILKNPLCKVCSNKQNINSTNYLLNMIRLDENDRH